jgi:hypothetical protein
MPYDLTVRPGAASSTGTRPADPKKSRLEALKAAAEAATSANAATVNPAALIKYIPAAECPDRNRIVFDDSGSMEDHIPAAKKGVVEYLRNCLPNQTAVGINFMNTTSELDNLNSNLIELATTLTELNLCSGGTPFFNTLKRALESKPVLTRLIAFTDGAPTDALSAETDSELDSVYGGFSTSADVWKHSADIIIKIALAVGGGTRHIPIDTVYFGENNQWNTKQIELLKYLSDATGGYFLHFNPKIPNIFKQLKYLAPVNRLQLASESFRAEVERGK